MARTARDHENGIVRKRDRKILQMGESCTLIKDPLCCYVKGLSFDSGEVKLTAAEGNWAEGTQFFTRAAVRIGKKKVVRRWVHLVYEVRGTELVQLSREIVEGSQCHNCLRDTPYEVCSCGFVICPECSENDGHNSVSPVGAHWVRRVKGQAETPHPHYARRARRKNVAASISA